MRSSHSLDRLETAFDDDRLVAHAGLLLEQVEGYSLAAQERAIGEACQARGYELIRMYRDEGISAHTDQLSRRPGLVQLLEDAGDGDFDAMFVHTLDRWARNLGVALQAINRLSAARVGLISIAENIDYATGQGRLNLYIRGAFAEFLSDSLAGHVRKARRERFERGLRNGALPLGTRPAPVPPTASRVIRTPALGWCSEKTRPQPSST